MSIVPKSYWCRITIHRCISRPACAQKRHNMDMWKPQRIPRSCESKQNLGLIWHKFGRDSVTVLDPDGGDADHRYN